MYFTGKNPKRRDIRRINNIGLNKKHQNKGVLARAQPQSGVHNLAFKFCFSAKTQQGFACDFIFNLIILTLTMILSERVRA